MRKCSSLLIRRTWVVTQGCLRKGNKGIQQHNYCMEVMRFLSVSHFPFLLCELTWAVPFRVSPAAACRQWAPCTVHWLAPIFSRSVRAHPEHVWVLPADVWLAPPRAAGSVNPHIWFSAAVPWFQLSIHAVTEMYYNIQWNFTRTNPNKLNYCL